MRLSLSEILVATGAVGDIGEGGNPIIAEVSTDSRTLRPGGLFVCVPGDRFDGHNFAVEAASRGAAAVLASRPLPELSPAVPVLLVRDTVAALGRLATSWRAKTGARLLAVTGSAGKTTVKELAAAILSQKASTAKNYKNFNNRLGLPLSMLAASARDVFWVMELGVSLPGEMEELAAIARPDVAVIHNIGPAHLEGLGDLAGVARAKTALLGFLAKGGQALVSMDYPELWEAAKSVRPNVLAMTTRGRGASFSAKYLGAAPGGRGRFLLDLMGLELEVAPPLCGSHFAENVLAAAGAAMLMGAGAPEIEAGLSSAIIPEQRFLCRAHGCFVAIDDTYNANPLSMRRSIEAAAEMAGERPLVLVLGEMREMGASAEREHDSLGAFIGRTGAAAVFYKGAFATEVEAGLARGGFSGTFARVGAPEAFAAALAALDLPGGVVLFKGSRSLGMEAFHQAFVQRVREDRA